MVRFPFVPAPTDPLLVAPAFPLGATGYHARRSSIRVPVSSTIEPGVILHGIRWATYERMLRDLDGGRVRLTYDSGTLEIMPLSPRHEVYKRRIGRMIEAMTLELDVPILSAGSTTWRRRRLRKGLEPDECYWVQHERDVRGKLDIDLRFDPPPDLAVEVDVTTSSMDRMAIYGALGIGEVWRWDEQYLRVLVLDDAERRHRERPGSRCFPWLPIAEFAAFLRQPADEGETRWMRGFVDWVGRALTRPDAGG